MINRLLFQFIAVLAATVTVTGQPGTRVGFIEFVAERINAGSKSESTSISAIRSIDKLCDIENSVFAKRVFMEYGAMFAANESVKVPPFCIFDGEPTVTAFRNGLATQTLVIGAANILLQKAAADSFYKILEEAAVQQISIVPFDGSIAGGRTYFETVRLWNSRFEPALSYWTGRGAIDSATADAARLMPLAQQVEKVIEWESQGQWFGPNRRTSIFSSTAPPGTSQHLALLAIDIAPPITPAKRALLNSHGWYQTVRGDTPHFTFLGFPESELPKRGLKAILMNGTIYWVPNIE